MSKNKQPTSRDRWFIAERPITSADADAFSHDTIAQVLAESIHQAVEDFARTPGAATIGLIGAFGTGKTSVVNLASKRLRTDLDVNVVHVSADKHSGNARSRNIVHSIAGELVNEGLLKEHEVNDKLQWLRSSVSLAAPAPEEMRLAKILSDPHGQSLKDIWSTLAVAGAFFLLTLISALFVDGGIGTVMSTVGSLAFVGAFFTVAYKHIVGSLFEIPKRSTNQPRADAADDVQQVFANLVNKYTAKNNDRSLVVFVDDIDRLGTADVLDAMRAIKSLQAVPRGKEPTFVVSCDDEIVLAALKDQARTDDQAEAIDPTAGISSDGTEAAARAYLDKFFSLRITMPPHVSDDMPTYVQRLLPNDHPLRSGDHISPESLQSAMLVLARGDVHSPRHLVHRVNAFLTSFRIAHDREKVASNQRLHPGDGTGRPILLARLSVIATDFRWFHRCLLEEENLLGAADRLARNEDLTATDEELLTDYGVAIRESAATEPFDDGEEPDGPAATNGAVRLVWNPRHEDLRTYLVSTFLNVERSSESIVPLLYLAQPEGGRVLGNAKVGALITAVRNGDVSRVEEALEHLPGEHLNVAADQIREAVSGVTSAELPAALTGATAALPLLGEHAEPVAVAIAERLPRIPASTLSESAYHDLLGALPDTHHTGVLRSFATVDDGMSEDHRMARALSAARYLVHDPNAAYLPQMVRDHLDRLPDHAGWAEAHGWVDVARDLDRAVHGGLLADHLVPNIFRLAVGDSSVEFDDTARGLLRLVESLDTNARNALGSVLRGIAPKSEGSAQLLVAAYDLIGHVEHTEGALRLAEASRLGLEGSVAANAVELLGRSVPVWKDTRFKKEDEADEDEEPRFCADTIGEALASLISTEPGRAISDTLSAHAQDFASSSRVFARIRDAALVALEETESSSSVNDALLTIVQSLLTTDTEDADEDAAAVERALQPFAISGDLSPKAKSLLPIVQRLGSSDEHRTRLDPEIARWGAVLKTNDAPYLKHPQVEALNSLDSVAPGAAGSAVDPVFASLQQWLQTGNDPDQLRTLAALPWVDHLQAAVDLVASKADGYPAFDDVVPILRRAQDRNAEIPDDLLRRFVDHVEADPIARIPQARLIWPAFSPPQQCQMLLAALPGSDTATELLAAASPTTLRSVVMDAANNGKMDELLEVLDLRSRSDQVSDLVSALVDEHAKIEKAHFHRLIEPVDQPTVAAVLVGRLREPSGEARTALQLLSHLDAVTVEEVAAEIDDAAAEQLRAWDESVVDTLRELRGDSPLSPRLEAAVDEMLSEDDGARAKALKLKPKKGLFYR